MSWKLAAVLLAVSCCTGDPEGKPTQPIVRVVDADTVELEGGIARLIGPDCPETVHPTRPVECYGPESSLYAKERLRGAQVYIEYGPERVDFFGRTLVYIHHDGEDFNYALIRKGYCRAYKRFDHPRLELYLLAEAEAKKENIGLWRACR